MSEVVLSNTSYDYSNGSMMVNINPGLVQKSSSSPTTNNGLSPPAVVSNFHTAHHQQQYSTYPAYAFQPMPMGYPPVPNYQPMSRLGYFNNERQQPNSPESISSSSPPTPSPPPTTTTHANNNMSYSTTTVTSSQQSNNDLITPLVPSSSTPSNTTPTIKSSSNNNNQFNNPTTARVKEMITRANSVPMEFYHTEFLEYSKETYEKKMESKRNKRKRPACAVAEENNIIQHQFSVSKKQKIVFEEKGDSEEEIGEEEDSDEKLVDDNHSNVSSAEIRRQIHIQSEQKRRAQIKDGFDELRKHLPGCNNKKMSKAALLTRTVQQLQHLKGMQNELLSEVERLLQENETLKKFQHGVLQRQAMEKMYTF